MSRLLFILATSYLLGSIPFGYLLVRIFRGEDVRQSGSGNIGATNVSRKSPVLGALTLLLDAAKGWLPVQFAAAFFPQPNHRMMAAAALCAIFGHMFPLWLAFRGGKGVATSLGAFLRFSPLATFVAVMIFLVVVLISRRISLGSIVASALFPSTVWVLDISRDPAVLALIGASALLVILKHHRNINRLLTGTEPRFSLRPKE
jgi:acyl phosphate:glycerol-3-phosphate acyltransferase